MNFTLECEQEEDGRRIAEVQEPPGVLAYGSSSADVMSKAEVLALRVIADQLENGEAEPASIQFSPPLSARVIGRQSKPRKYWQPCRPLDGDSTVRHDRTRRLNVQAIRTMSLRSIMARRLDLECWRTSPSTLASNQEIYYAGSKSYNKQG
jgi:predicted RNase H-like HicB family nuclease